MVYGRPNTAYGQEDGIARKCHMAFACSLDQLLAAIRKLNKHGIETFGFGGHKTHEPTVIGWMPSAQIYFRDPDGHMLEFISILPDPPDPSFNGAYLRVEKIDDEVQRESNLNAHVDTALSPAKAPGYFRVRDRSARDIQTSSFRNLSTRPA